MKGGLPHEIFIHEASLKQTHLTQKTHRNDSQLTTLLVVLVKASITITIANLNNSLDYCQVDDKNKIKNKTTNKT